MANRVNAEEVKEILDTTLDDSVVETFITAANLTVTRLLSDQGLEDAELKEIERWLSAHFLACTRELQPKTEQAGGAQVAYQGTTAMGLDATFYGQQVKILDTTGLLASTVGRRNVSIFMVPSFVESGVDDE